MQVYKFLCCVCMLAAAMSMNATEFRGSISGSIVDAVTKQPVAGVTIRLLSTKSGAVSTESGIYKIADVPVGTYSLEYKRIGYATMVKTDIIVRSSRITEVSAEMIESPVVSEEVTVRPAYFSQDINQVSNTLQFSNEEIRRAPGSFGDISRIVSGMPSTAKVDDQSNALIVRGGSPIENGFYVDNIEITNINHFPSQGTSAGSTSIIPVDLLQSADFSAGGFSAAYGDKLSSIMNIQLRKGNSEETDLQLDFNVMGFGGIIDGPFANGKATYILAARRSYLDLLAEAAGINLLPSFGDAQIKITYDIDNKHSLSLLGIFSDDHIQSDSVNARENKQTAYGSDDIYDGTVGINWRYLWGENAYTQTSVAFTHTNFNNHYRDNVTGKDILRKQSIEQYVRLRSISAIAFSPFISLECGVEAKYIHADNSIRFGLQNNAVGDSVGLFTLQGKKDASRGGLFTTITYTPFSVLKIAAGMRVEYATISETITYSPKISIVYSLSDHSVITANTGIYYQGIPLLMAAQNPALTKPQDMQAIHYVLGFQQILSADTRLLMEIYGKEYKGFPVDPNEAGLFAVDEPYDRIGFYTYHPALVMSGKARSYGAEISVQKKLSDNFYGITGLSWFRSEYAGYDGVWRNRVFDNRIVFSIEGGITLSKDWEISSRWIYAGGRPYTPFNTELSRQTGIGILDDTRINSSRFPAYHSLNIRADKRFFFEKSTLIAYISIWNVYNRNNAQAIIWNQFDMRPDTVSQFGLLPVFGLEWEL